MSKRERRLLKKITFILLVVFVAFGVSRCALKRFIKSDNEITSHYEHTDLKPSYRKVPLGKRDIHYAVMSKNDTLPLVVFVHGAPGAWYGYMNLMDDTLLQDNFKLISVDRLGYGKSGYGNPELSVDHQAASIQAIIEKENTSGKKVILCGRSYGAPITACVAMEHPEQVDRLLMVSPVIDPAKEKFYWFSNAGKWKVVQWLLPELMNVATAEKFAHAGEMEKMLPRWSSLNVPTTVITGDQDQIADTANFTFARKHLVNCDTTLIRLKDVGHQVTYDRPDLIKDLLMKQQKNCGERALLH